MKTLVLYASRHHHNTEKIAKAIQKAWLADIWDYRLFPEEKWEEYDLIALGSGIYHMYMDKKLMRFLKKKLGENKMAVFFFTSGFQSNTYSDIFWDALEKMGFKVLGGFSSLGWNSFGPLFFLGGAHKTKPDAKDEEEARRFALRMMEKAKKVKHAKEK